MADTITYDPSNDPQAIAEAEARDGENLAVGEEMAKEQSNLLAGKYKDAEELEKAYIELQKKMCEGGEDTPLPSDDTQYVPEGYEDGYTEEGDVSWEKVGETYGSEVSQLFQKADLDPWEISSHFHSNNGQITAEQKQSLINAGLSEMAVDSYLAGQAQKFGYTEQAQPVLTEAEANEMMNLVGGEQNYNALTEWAGQNLPEEDVNAFDEVINTGNKAAVRFAIKAMKGQYDDAVGVQPELKLGKASNERGQTYRSMAEVVRDMESPRYEKDEAYRFDVMQKLERSNLKV